jgi:hypothetical protein
MPGIPDVAVLMICSKLLPTTTKRKKPAREAGERQPTPTADARHRRGPEATQTRMRAVVGRHGAKRAQPSAPSMAGPTENGLLGRAEDSGTLPRRSTLR